jgi:hypothetical protein
MKSLEVQALRKVEVFKNKTLAEILALCEDGNNPDAAKYRDILFKSRDSLLALFEVYMTRDIGAPFREEPDATQQRNEFITILNRRQDIQTATECENFFTAMVRGFSWDYVVTLPWPPNDDDMHIIMPRMATFKPAHFHHIPVLFTGTLPTQDCMGVLFDYEILTTDDEGREASSYPTMTMTWKLDKDVLGDKKFTATLYKELVSVMYGDKTVRDPGSKRGYRVTVEIDLLRDGDPLMILEQQYPDFDATQDIVKALVDYNLNVTIPHRQGEQEGKIYIKVYMSIAGQREVMVVETGIGMAPFLMQ